MAKPIENWLVVTVLVASLLIGCRECLGDGEPENTRGRDGVARIRRALDFPELHDCGLMCAYPYTARDGVCTCDDPHYGEHCEFYDEWNRTRCSSITDSFHSPSSLDCVKACWKRGEDCVYVEYQPSTSECFTCSDVHFHDVFAKEGEAQRVIQELPKPDFFCRKMPPAIEVPEEVAIHWRNDTQVLFKCADNNKSFDGTRDFMPVDWVRHVYPFRKWSVDPHTFDFNCINSTFAERPPTMTGVWRWLLPLFLAITCVACCVVFTVLLYKHIVNSPTQTQLLQTLLHHSAGSGGHERRRRHSIESLSRSSRTPLHRPISHHSTESHSDTDSDAARLYPRLRGVTKDGYVSARCGRAMGKGLKKPLEFDCEPPSSANNNNNFVSPHTTFSSLDRSDSKDEQNPVFFY